jgi:glycosyltransferase involved in cell wall biosynthesis
MKRLAIVASHPVQYYAPLFRELARRCDLHVFYAHVATPEQQAAAGFGTAFDWDVDLRSGYPSNVLRNVATSPGTDRFAGCDTPEIGQVLRREKFDALLVMGWHLKTFLQAIFSAKRMGLPVMVRGDSHLETPRHPLKRLGKAVAYPALLRAFDAVLYVGLRNRRYYQYYGYPRRRLFHSPHCVDTQWFDSKATHEAGQSLRARLGIAPSEDVVLFAGKLVPFKRPLDAVVAVTEVAKARPASLLVAGSGPMGIDLAREASQIGIRTRLLGFCNQSEMPAVYAASQLLVLPSTGRETWGLVCNEAIACGRPIVVSDAVGCAPDLVGVGRAGRTFKVGDVTDFAASIAATLSDPPSANRLKAVSEAHSLRAAADGVMEALHAIAE